METFALHLAVMPLILLFDHCFRDPNSILGLPHPVILIGRLITRCESAFYSENRPFFAGLLAVLCVLAVVVTPVWGLDTIITFYFGFNVLGMILAAWLIAARGLFDHVQQVQQHSAQGDLEAARTGLYSLAGRNTEHLTESAILRTAGESLAENFSDAVIAPLFYYVLFGLPGIVAYKTINTLDSMWGYRSPRFLYFGRTAARLDDVANYLPARISALLLLLAGIVKRRAPYLSALRILWRDARKHPSPNAGYPEAAMAGLAGLRFGGPRQYAGGVQETAWLGDGRTDWQADDLNFCLGLYRWTIVVVVILTGTVGAALWIPY